MEKEAATSAPSTAPGPIAFHRTIRAPAFPAVRTEKGRSRGKLCHATWAGEWIVKEPVRSYLSESREEATRASSCSQSAAISAPAAGQRHTASLPSLARTSLPASAMVLIWTQFGVNHKNVNVKCKVRVMHRGDSAGSSSSAVSLSASLLQRLFNRFFWSVPFERLLSRFVWCCGLIQTHPRLLRAQPIRCRGIVVVEGNLLRPHTTPDRLPPADRRAEISVLIPLWRAAGLSSCAEVLPDH